jgi:hypothetical protein
MPLNDRDRFVGAIAARPGKLADAIESLPQTEIDAIESQVCPAMTAKEQLQIARQTKQNAKALNLTKPVIDELTAKIATLKTAADIEDANRTAGVA